MDCALAPTTEAKLKFFNFAEWTGLDVSQVETAPLRYESNGKIAACKATEFELRLTLTENQLSSKTSRSHYTNLS